MGMMYHDVLNAESVAVKHLEQAKKYMELYRDEMAKYREALKKAEYMRDRYMEYKQDAYGRYADREPDADEAEE